MFLEDVKKLIKENEQKNDITSALTVYTLKYIENNSESFDKQNICKFKSSTMDCENLEDFVSILEDSLDKSMNELQDFIVFEEIDKEEEKNIGDEYGLQ